MKNLILLIIILLTMTSCRLYERDYLEEIPIPVIVVDTLGEDPWDGPVTDDPIR